MRGSYRTAVTVFGILAITIGIGMLVQTARHGGGLGYVLGLLFVALGAGRIYLLHRRR
jgi:uncharacterized membrane protein